MWLLDLTKHASVLSVYYLVKTALLHILIPLIKFGIFPEKMKIEKDSPIFKPGREELLPRHEPIPVLPYFSNILVIIMHNSVVVITTAYIHLTKPVLKFCTCSNPTCGVLEVCSGENLWQWSRLKIKLKPFRWSTVPKKQFAIIVLGFTHTLTNITYHLKCNWVFQLGVLKNMPWLNFLVNY